jgi:DNA-binding NarL/FixJ family response regulator
MTRRIRVLCVDDHRVVLEGIAAILRRQPDMELIAAEPSGEEAIKSYRRYLPDITLMDLQLPAMSGIDAIRAIRREYPDARMVVLTMFLGDEDVHRALEAGAAAYLLKDTVADDLVRTIRQVHSGARWLPPTVVAALESRHAYDALTAREVTVLELVAKGLRNKEIAATLGISEATTKIHVRNTLLKLRVNDRTAAVTLALHRGIIHLEDRVT